MSFSGQHDYLYWLTDAKRMLADRKSMFDRLLNSKTGLPGSLMEPEWLLIRLRFVGCHLDGKMNSTVGMIASFLEESTDEKGRFDLSRI
jgi:hypothetical protein